jgi:hypothetical protein
MKVIRISKDGKEFAKVRPNHDTILVGRSPACDVVLRTTGIKPIHFLIERLSEAENDEETGLWTVFDISESASTSRKQLSETGQGIIINDQKAAFKGFDFQISVDNLQETDLKPGALTRGLSRIESKTSSVQRGKVLETVVYSKELELVTNIRHFHWENNRKPLRLFAFNQDLEFIWEEKENSATLKYKGSIESNSQSSDGFEVFNRGSNVSEDFFKNQMLGIGLQDFIQLETDESEFYLRLVDPVEVNISRFGWLRDTVLAVLVATVLTTVGVYFWIKDLPRVQDLVQDTAPRVATVEIKDLQQKPPPEPELLKPKQENNPQASVEQTQESKVESAPAKAPHVISRPKEKVKAGLNQEAPVKNVNTLGLLGKLSPAAKSVQKVSADQVMQQVDNAQIASGEHGKVAFNTPPVGEIGIAKAKVPANQNNLVEASTTLSGADVVDKGAKAPIAGKNIGSGIGDGSKIGAGFGLGGATSHAGSNSLGDQTQMSVQGGLEKDAIRAALAENRRAITSCYETALMSRSKIEGRMTFRWVVSGDGNVTTIRKQASNIGFPQFEDCVETVVKGIIFPKSKSGQSTTVIYPFIFQGKK